MVNFCLSDDEKNILKSLLGRKLLKFRHDSLEKFEGAVYGRIELFFDDLIIMLNYDYKPYPLFNSKDDEHPMFEIKIIKETEAVSAFLDTSQIDIKCESIIKEIILVEDQTNVEWDNKKDDVRILTAIIFKLEDKEIAFQGDYMIPLIDILKGDNLLESLACPGHDEFNQHDVKSNTIRELITIR